MRPVQISVSDEITQVHEKKDPPSRPPPLPRAALKPPTPASAMPRVRAVPAVLPPPSRLPPPIPRELPRASMIPPSFVEFELAPDSSEARPGSDPTFAPMAITSNTPSRSKLSSARPNASWAMALLAIGVFAGVVTAIVAGGDTDTILRASARFIDPDASRAAAALAPRTPEPAFKTAALTQPGAPVPPAAHEKALVADIKPIVGEPVHIKPEPKAEPKVAAKPEPKVDAPAKETKPEPKPEVKAEVKVAAKVEPKPEPKVAWTAPVRRAEPKPAPLRFEKVEKAEKVAEKADKPEEDLPLTASKKRRDELASAAAANALAKAQLEGSL